MSCQQSLFDLARISPGPMPAVKATGSKSIYDQFCRIVAENPEMLQDYRDDLEKTDRAICENMQADEQYLWVLRTHGTNLFPVAAGQDPGWITPLLHIPNKVFLVTVKQSGGAAGTLKEIDFDQANRLAFKPAPAGKLIWRVAPFHMVAMRDGQELAWLRIYCDLVYATMLVCNAYGHTVRKDMGAFMSFKGAIAAIEPLLLPIY